MAGVMTSPFAVAAVVLIVAGVAKLRSPLAAAGALRTLGVSADPVLVRGFAIVEIALGGWAAIRPGTLIAAGLGVLYAGFTCLAWLLARRQASCGCFGDREHPASRGQSILSAVLAATAGAAAIWHPHGFSWLAGHPVVAIGVAGAAYATVLAYTALPVVWSAWAGAAR